VLAGVSTPLWEVHFHANPIPRFKKLFIEEERNKGWRNKGARPLIPHL